MYFLFPSTVIGLFKTFYCTEPIGETFSDPGALRYLRTNLAEPCYTGDHLLSVWVAIALLIFYIAAVPGAIAFITKLHRSQLYTKSYMPVEGLRNA